MSLYAHPVLSDIAAGHRRPRPLKSDASRAMHARRVAACFSPYIPAFFCPVHTRESLAAPNLEHDYLTCKTGHMWPLWITWQHNAETAVGELKRCSAPKDLAVWGECSRADTYIYLCLFVFTLVLLHMKWHILYMFPLLAAFLTINTYGYTHYSICVHTSTCVYTYISTMHMPMYTCFHILTYHIPQSR